MCSWEPPLGHQKEVVLEWEGALGPNTGLWGGLMPAWDGRGTGSSPGSAAPRRPAWVPGPLTFGIGSSLSPEGGGGGTAAGRHGGLDGEALPPPEWNCQWLSRLNKLQAKWPPRVAL